MEEVERILQGGFWHANSYSRPLDPDGPTISMFMREKMQAAEREAEEALAMLCYEPPQIMTRLDDLARSVGRSISFSISKWGSSSALLSNISKACTGRETSEEDSSSGQVHLGARRGLRAGSLSLPAATGGLQQHLLTPYHESPTAEQGQQYLWQQELPPPRPGHGHAQQQLLQPSLEGQGGLGEQRQLQPRHWQQQPQWLQQQQHHCLRPAPAHPALPSSVVDLFQVEGVACAWIVTRVVFEHSGLVADPTGFPIPCQDCNFQQVLTNFDKMIRISLISNVRIGKLHPKTSLQE